MSLLTIDSAACLLSCTPSTIRRLVRLRAIPFIELPIEDPRFDRNALLEWAADHAHPVEPAEDCVAVAQ